MHEDNYFMFIRFVSEGIETFSESHIIYHIGSSNVRIIVQK